MSDITQGQGGAEVITRIPEPALADAEQMDNEENAAQMTPNTETPRKEKKPRPFVIQTPVDVRSVSLAVLAVLASIAALYWARMVFIPITIGIIASYALSPIVDTMERLHIPRSIGAALLLAAIMGGAGAAVYSLGDEASKLVATLPDAVQKIRDVVRKERAQKDGAIDQVQRAASKLEELAKDSTPALPTAPRGVTRVQIEKPRLNIGDYLWVGASGALATLGETIIVLFLIFFLLASGDVFRRKFVKISGPTLSKKKVTVQVLDEIHSQIQRFLLIQILAGILVGIATWLAFLWIGVEHAAVWGIAAAILNAVPYMGAIIVTFGTALVGFLQFGTPGMALLVSGVALLITSLEGFLLTPWLTGRACRMNPVAVFIAVLFWGWLWGPWGLLLGVPITVVIKVICDHVEDLAPIGELLGDSSKSPSVAP